MNLKSIYEFQKDYEDKFQKKSELQDKTLLSQKLLALQVKLGELASETQCFKFWLKKKSVVNHKIIEKYVEVLCAIFSIGIEKGFNETDFTVKKVEDELTKHFLTLFVDLNDFLVSSSKDQYITLMEDFLSLSLSLDFDENDILDIYKKVFTA